MCPVLSWLVGQAQIPDVLPELECRDPSVGVLGLSSPMGAHILPIAFETEQEDETKAPGEGKAGAEERQFQLFQS